MIDANAATAPILSGLSKEIIIGTSASNNVKGIINVKKKPKAQTAILSTILSVFFTKYFIRAIKPTIAKIFTTIIRIISTKGAVF